MASPATGSPPGIREAAREDVVERYPASRIARRTADLYERLLAR